MLSLFSLPLRIDYSAFQSYVVSSHVDTLETSSSHRANIRPIDIELAISEQGNRLHYINNSDYNTSEQTRNAVQQLDLQRPMNLK